MKKSNTPSPFRRTIAGIAAVAAAATLTLAAPTGSFADSKPANPSDPKTPVTAAIDRLPTVQHNGVAWNQLVVGNTVYVVGKFTKARPAGAAAGTSEVTRNNILAYNLTTGELLPFNPNLNGQAFSAAKSPDGTKIYIGGDFTTVGGVAKSHIAAVNPTTGALISSFTARTDGSVRAVTATSSTVFLGGSFSTINGVARQKLGSVQASNGALLAGFAPKMTGLGSANPRVNALQLSPTSDRIVVGGSFATLNGSSNPGYGLGMLNATTGANQAFSVNGTVRNAGANAAIWSLNSDGSNVYGTGYVFGSGGNFEGTFSANWTNGGIKWLEDCHGDSYGVYPSATAVYVVGHPHYCLNLGGYGETSPAQRALAFSKAATGVLTKDTRGYASFTGQPAPSLQNFFPQLTTGTFTGQNQAAWTVSGSGDYVVLAGEFKVVNGTGQQGMVRLANANIAPNKQGPKASAANFTPTVSSPTVAQARINWTANYDYDNSNLTYTIYRDGSTTPLTTITRASTWYSRPAMTYTDIGVSSGSHSYKVKVVDPFGNSQTSPSVTVTVK